MLRTTQPAPTTWRLGIRRKSTSPILAAGPSFDTEYAAMAARTVFDYKQRKQGRAESCALLAYQRGTRTVAAYLGVGTAVRS